MRPISVVAVGFLLSASLVSADTIGVEIDLDGSIGNGPDFLGVPVNNYFDVDIWITGSSGCGIVSSNFTICNPDGNLEFQGYNSVDIPPVWTITPPVDQGNGCILFQAIDFTFTAPLSVPFLQGVATYEAAVDHALADLIIDLGPFSSGQLNTCFADGPFDYAINASVQIGATSTAETGWGEIKSLFR